MQWFLDHPGPTAAIVAGLLVLVIIALAPALLANVLDQIFQLLGRLVGVIASEAEAGASGLFAIVRGMFNMSSGGDRRPAASTARAATPDSADGQPAQARSGTPAQEPDTPFMWVAETIFVRLLYLATVIVVVGSDFVFAILRLQAVLFPSLPTPIHDLTLLSLLTGSFFVAIVLLTGALTLDFLNVLPEPARLFPNLSEGKRRFLLVVSILSFILSLFVVGALFLQGQLLVSEAATFPLGAIALATLIGVLQVMVVFLGAWGAIRGLAIILALLGGLVGIVLHLFAVVVRWLADGLDVLGSIVLTDLVWAIAAIFGHRRERPARPSIVSNVLSVVGYGDRGALFASVLCESLVRMYGRTGLLAAGVYAEEPSVREDARTRLARLGVNIISPIAANDTAPLDTLKTRMIHAYQGKGPSNKMALWVVDGERAAECAATLSELKRGMRDLSVIVLCLLPPGGVRGSNPFAALKQLATEKLSDRGETAISTTIVVDDRSPLYRTHGEPVADQLVARSLSGMLLAPLHGPSNPSFVTVLRTLRDAGNTFAALSTDSAGIVTGEAVSQRRGGGGSVSHEQALSRTEETAKRLLTGATATTVETVPNKQQPGLYVNFIVPIASRDPEFAKYRGQISNWLAEEPYPIYLYGVVEGEGAVPSDATHTIKGDRYCQVGVLYGVDEAELSARALASGTRVVDAGDGAH